MTSRFPARPQLPTGGDERIRRPSPSRITQDTLSSLGRIFAKRPLMLGESETDYDEFFASMLATVEPEDLIEHIWLKDLVDQTWEVQRLKRLKATVLLKAGKETLTKLLSTVQEAGVGDGGRALTGAELVAAYAAGDAEAVEEVDRVLGTLGTDMDAVSAQVLADELDQIGTIEGMIAATELRRNRLLIEIEARRDALARRLRLAGLAAPAR